ncbi:caspase family protein [Micromonospora sp. NPDC050980]|uniref:caspase, EACC1-associated type n=1 Tax=Micromonospora sp. NPDC050980 TaxID=3155161 RepID=UPI0033C22D55
MRRALIIANEAYADPQFASLPGAVADADSLREVLRHPGIGAFDDVRVLRNHTVHHVGRAVATFFHHAKPDDLLLLHISAHGLKDAAGDLFFAAADSEHDSHLIRATALSAADIRHEMADSAAKQIVVLLDCCYSGAFARDERARGVHDADLTGPFRSRGHVVITSCAGTELSFERDGQGVFTRAVVDGLRTGRADRNGDGVIDTDELYHHVADRVREVNSRQRPTLSVHRKEGVIRVAWAGRVPPPPPPGDGSLDRLRRRFAAPISRRGALPRRLIAPVLAVWALLCAVAGHAGPVGAADAGCFQPPEVRVATSAAGLQPYREVADAFERWSARQHRGCPLARIYLYPAAADDVRAGIGARWDSSGEPGHRYLRDVGPHPDLWLPESAGDVARLGGSGAGVLGRVDEIAASPVVLGVPQAQVPAGGAVDAARRMGRTWRELFGVAVGATAGPAIAGGNGVVRADPAVSAPARLGTYALYGGERGPLPASTARQDVERWVEQALDGGSYPIGDDLALLCRQRTRATAAPAATAGVGTPAVVLTEQALVRYNQGRPLGAGCPARQAPPAAERLQAFYPSDSPLLFLTVARLHWPEAVQSPAVRAGAANFVRWLVDEEAGQQALLLAGLRPPGVTATAPLDRANGALFDWPFARVRPLHELAAADQDRVREVYRRAHRPGRVLVALDASGSMRDPSEDRRRSRFEVAVDGVGRSLQRVGGRDEFGLRTFSTVAANARSIVPLGPPGAAAGGLRAAVQRIRPAGDTPLHQAIRQGAAQLRGGGGDPLRGLVVVTDGQDTTGRPPPTLAELSGVRLYVLAVGDAACAGSPLDRLAQRTGGDCYDARADRLDATLDRLFTALWKGAD